MPNVRQIAWPNYLVATSLVCFPLYEVFANSLLPIRVHDARWRFTAFGLLSPSLLLITVGVMMAFWVAHTFEHRTVQGVLGIGSLFGAVIILGLTSLFALDVLQVRSGVRPEAIGAFTAASVLAATRALACSVAIAGFGLAAVRAAASFRRGGATRSGRLPTAAPPLVTGRGSSTEQAGRV